MAIRKFEYEVQLDSGLIIPAGSAEGRLLTSDGTGKATWKAPAKVGRIQTHAFAIFGEPTAAKTYPGFSVALATGEEKKLIGIQYRIESGVSMVVKLLLNKAKVEESEVTVKNEAPQRTTFASATTLAAKDYLSIEVVSVKEAPLNLSFVALVESIV